MRTFGGETGSRSNDMWIAALILQHGLVLLYRDRHFTHLRQLATIELT